MTRVHDHTVLAINARTSEVIGIPQRDAVGLSISDFYVDPSERVQLVERLGRYGRADNLRVRVKRANGEPFWVLGSSRLVTWQGSPRFSPCSTTSASSSPPKRRSRPGAAARGSKRRADEPHRAIHQPQRAVRRTPAKHPEISAHALNVERLSMWRFDDERSIIRCGYVSPRRRPVRIRIRSA